MEKALILFAAVAVVFVMIPIGTACGAAIPSWAHTARLQDVTSG